MRRTPRRYASLACMVLIQVLLDDFRALLVQRDLARDYLSQVLLSPPVALRTGDFLAAHRQLVPVVVAHHFHSARHFAHYFAHVG